MFSARNSTLVTAALCQGLASVAAIDSTGMWLVVRCTVAGAATPCHAAFSPVWIEAGQLWLKKCAATRHSDGAYDMTIEAIKGQMTKSRKGLFDCMDFAFLLLLSLYELCSCWLLLAMGPDKM